MEQSFFVEWLDYGFRMYDPALGRWHIVDPMTDKHPDYTPYAYCYNNPALFIDYCGLDTLLPDVTGKNFYLPEAAKNISYFSKDKVIGKESGNQYSVQKGSVKSFDIGDRTYSANFNKETGDFSGYKTSNGETYNQFEKLPLIVKERVKYGMPDLLSFSANIESTFLVGASSSWQFNMLSIGSEKGWFYSRSSADTWGFGVDWGFNLNEVWYVGPKNLEDIMRKDVEGKFSYWQGNFIVGFGKFKGYDPKGKIVWKGNITGGGFGFGGSYGEGRTTIP